MFPIINLTHKIKHVILKICSLFFSFSFLFSNLSLSQVYCDSTNYLTIQSLSSKVSDNCRNYMNYTVYPYYNMTPIKYIRISFWVIQKSDGSGSFKGTDNQITNYFQNLVSSINQQLANLCSSIPLEISNNCITDSRIRVMLNKIHFIKNDALYNYTLHKVKNSKGNYYYPDNIIGDSIFKYVILPKEGLTPIDRDSTLHIIMEPMGVDGIFGGQARLMNSKWYIITRAYDMAYNNDGQYLAIKKQRGHLIHEIFHTLGLGHSFEAPCFPVQSRNSTNNFMDYPSDPNDWSTLCSFTECQISLVHFIVGAPSSYINKCYIRDYCTYHDDQSITISSNQNITWNSSKNLLGNVEIWGTLNVECTISIPKGGKVIIKNGGKLFINQGSFDNKCEQKWEGIEVQNGGYLELTNVSISDHSITILNGGTLKISSNVNIVGNNRIDIMKGGYVCIENNSTLNLQDELSVLNLHNDYKWGINPVFSNSSNCVNNLANIIKIGEGTINLYNDNVFIQNRTFNNIKYITGNNIFAGSSVMV